MEQLIILGVVWVLLGRWFGWGRGCGQRRLSRRPNERWSVAASRGWAGFAQADRGCGSVQSARRAYRESVAARESGTRSAERQPPPAIAAVDPVESLQRKWVDGRISDLEYEQALDDLYARTPRA